MKRVAAMLAIVGFVATTSFAGVVEFDPAEMTFTEGQVPAFVDVSLIITSTNAGNVGDVSLVASSDVLGIGGFTYDPAFISGTAFRTDPPVPLGIFTNDLFFGGFATSPFALPLTVGTLRIDLNSTAGGSLAVGDYTFGVDSSLDGGFSNVNSGEAVAGAGVVHVVPVPEPATMALLGLGAVALLRRRFA